MIETKEQDRRVIHSEIAAKRILLTVKAYNPKAAAELDTTIEALRNLARSAWHPNSCKSQMTGDRPCSCGYQELRDAVPDWLME